MQSCEIVDQAQTESDESDLWFNSTTVDWQAFVPNLDNIVAIAVQVERSGDPGNLILRLKETESGKILIEEIRPATEVPESGWLKIYLSSWVEIIPGDTYQILINSDQPESSEYHHYSWFGNQDSSYAPPSSRSENPDMQDFDFTFITYGMAGCNFNYLPLIIKGFP